MSKESAAKALFSTLCATLDDMQWKYTKEQGDKDDGEDYVIRTNVKGDDFTMVFFLVVDVGRQLLYVKSPLPFKAPQERRELVAQAVVAANYRMLNGSFEMDLTDGYVAFKVVVPFAESIISQVTCKYVVLMACKMTDVFGGAIKNVSDGEWDLQRFMQFCVEV